MNHINISDTKTLEISKRNVNRKSSRHAYAIIAHNDKACLKTLLELIDDSRNDVYLLLDKKSSPSLEEGLECSRSVLHILPYNKRKDIRWGDLSMVEAELALFNSIINSQNEYSYIHLLSGQDLPLKTQDEIHDFFKNVPEGSNFLEINDSEENEKALYEKTNYYHPFTSYLRTNKIDGLSKGKTLFCKIIRKISLQFQKATGYKRNWGGMKLVKGIQWASITPEFAKYLIDRKDFIRKKFKGVLIPDEIYKQTMAVNSPFDSTILAFSRGNSRGIRLMDWNGSDKIGSPKIYTTQNLEELESAYELFARKFSSAKDPEIIDLIRKRLTVLKF